MFKEVLHMLDIINRSHHVMGSCHSNVRGDMSPLAREN